MVAKFISCLIADENCVFSTIERCICGSLSTDRFAEAFPVHLERQLVQQIALTAISPGYSCCSRPRMMSQLIQNMRFQKLLNSQNAKMCLAKCYANVQRRHQMAPFRTLSESTLHIAMTPFSPSTGSVGMRRLECGGKLGKLCNILEGC